MKKLNNLFFGQESITLSDGLWFYGTLTFITLLPIITVIAEVTR